LGANSANCIVFLRRFDISQFKWYISQPQIIIIFLWDNRFFILTLISFRWPRTINFAKEKFLKRSLFWFLIQKLFFRSHFYGSGKKRLGITSPVGEIGVSMIVINRLDEIGAAFRRDCFSDRSFRERSNRYFLGIESLIRSSNHRAPSDARSPSTGTLQRNGWSFRVIDPSSCPARWTSFTGKDWSRLARTRVKTDKWDPT